MLEITQNLLGLNQEISIIYVVEGFQAIFYKDDEDYIELARGFGETIPLALISLEFELAKLQQKPSSRN